MALSPPSPGHVAELPSPFLTSEMVLESAEGDPRDVASPDLSMGSRELGLGRGVRSASAATTLPTVLGALSLAWTRAMW